MTACHELSQEKRVEMIQELYVCLEFTGVLHNNEELLRALLRYTKEHQTIDDMDMAIDVCRIYLPAVWEDAMHTHNYVFIMH